MKTLEKKQMVKRLRGCTFNKNNISADNYSRLPKTEPDES